MNVSFVYMSRYPWDVRVEKIAKFLDESGHKVHILCRTSKDRPKCEDINNFSINRLRLFGNRFYKLNRLFDIPLPINPIWIKHISNNIRKNKIDLIIVRDIPLALPSIIAARLNRIPVVLDMAEHYGAMFADLIRDTTGWKKIPRFIMKNPWVADLIEKIVLKYIDHTMVVIEESKERLKKLGVPSEKISVVSNTPPIIKYSDDKVDLPSGLKIVYIGQLQTSRGLETVIRGFKHIINQDPDIHLYVGGSGVQTEYFKKLAKDQKIEDNFHFLGWVKPELTVKYINSCDIGIVPHLATKHWISTIPNKIFDYMLCGLPVLVSDAPPLKRIIDESGCGWSFKAGAPDDFAKKVLEISRMEDVSQIGLNGRKAVLERFNWANDCKNLQRSIEYIVSKK